METLTAVAALIFNANKDSILMVEQYIKKPHLRLGYKKTDTFWSLPGGKPEKNEGLISAVKREVLEETGLELISVEPIYTTNIINEKMNFQINTSVMLGEVEEYDLNPQDPDGEILRAAWINLQDFGDKFTNSPDQFNQKPLSAYLRNGIRDISWVHRRNRDGTEILLYPL